MNHLDIILPITLLLLAFILKLAIDRSIEVPTLIQAVCELPVDMIFLAVSFFVAYTISNGNDTSKGLFYSFSFIFLSVIVIILWRKSLRLFEGGNKLWILLLFINMGLSIFSLYTSMGVLLEQPKCETTQIDVNKNNAINPSNKQTNDIK